MDKIYLKDVEIFANHGVFKEEKVLGQKFIFDIELELDLSKAAKENDLTASVHYGELCHEVEAICIKESFDLIETLGEKVCQHILEKYEIVKIVKVKVKKPWAPIGRHLKYAAIEIERKRSISYLSIGSNIGDKEKNLKTAIDFIEEIQGVKVSKVASFIKTEPWGVVDQEEFLNGALEVETILRPKELMKKLLEVELKMKRKRELRWGPRIIDIDIIFFDDIISEDDFCVIPHPRMEDREFVLEPLNELCPNKIHPLLNKRVFRILSEIKK
ncbi:2-amino-4-hydroxy-6-hydroxymethyldihydropteridine diphosphokinase [uncultured Clostridium sp.]|uniref:2-amino-4-hydroxy-6- hydroxymethyldihydropteridine diphosphokinase n=1 Tax=uncultured Clostridium sp. TaxID=59620 RepID=UPI002625C3CC|nr:2-amino-4-hydroxy-6-hydroxymethyldihydropteridine diphosphokinase [uncultured Clostridium sp.]